LEAKVEEIPLTLVSTAFVGMVLEIRIDFSIGGERPG
jgi:hypothetical protein